jgi:hypothetical protein
MVKTIAVRAGLVLCITVSTHSTARAQLRTQSPLAPPELGIGVDTLRSPAWGTPWKAPVSAIYHRWAAFLASTAPRYTTPGGALSPFWVAAEQRRWAGFVLPLGLVGFEETPIVVDIRPATPGQDSVFVVKTMFMSPEPRAVRQPIALLRVYAVRERGDWVFSNALPRTTRGWQHSTVGPFEYIYAPGYRFDRARALRGAAFADSLAEAFRVPKVSNVEYYLTENPDEMNRIIGLDWYPSSTDGGAFSSGPNRLLVSGNPSVGEDYRHEIVHVVLAPMGGVNGLLWEGIATWLGGTLGMDASTSRKEYARYLRAHPDVTLDSIFTQSYEKGFRPAGAILCQMVFDHGGMPALKALFGVGRTDDDVKAGLQRLLGASWPKIQVEWRRKALM